jgi:hypothetical protein
MAVGERERAKVNMYGEKYRRVGAFFHPPVFRVALGEHIQDHSQDHQEACDADGSLNGIRPHVSSQLQKLNIKVQVLNANLVAMCMPYGDAYHTRSPPRNAGTSVQSAVVVRQSQMASHPHPLVRNVQAVIGT